MDALNNTTTASSQEHEPKLPRQRISRNSEYLIATIEGNKRENFLPEVVQSHSTIIEQEEWVRGEYEGLKFKIESYKEKIDSESEIYGDILFLESLIIELFKTYYSKDKPLASIFSNTEEKEKFYSLAGKYILEGYMQTLTESEEKYPKSFLTKEEKEALLREYDMSEEEQKWLWIWVDEGNK